MRGGQALKITALAISDRGMRLASLLHDKSEGAIRVSSCKADELPRFTAQILSGNDALILICTVAEAVRALSDVEYADIQSTLIVQTDEYAKYVVPLAPVGSHSARDLAKQVAGILFLARPAAAFMSISLPWIMPGIFHPSLIIPWTSWYL